MCTAAVESDGGGGSDSVDGDGGFGWHIAACKDWWPRHTDSTDNDADGDKSPSAPAQ
jgi:hypothetical protein